MTNDMNATATVVTTSLTTAQHAALAAAAKRAGWKISELVRILILFGLAKLDSGDAELLRAVKGSRDAGVR